MTMRAFLAGLLVMLAAFAVVAEPRSEEFMTPMRDGVALATTVYFPEGEGPWPAILTRTPYNKAGYGGERATRYTDAGYVFAAQDVRGKFASEGEYNPFEDDIEDGYDTVEWLAAQDFCDGKVGMSGASAMGITSNLAAAADPPSLVCAYVIVAPQSLFSESRFIGGIFKEAHAGGWMRAQGVPEEEIQQYKTRAVMDDRWRATDFVHRISNVDIPIYNVGGWYDIFLQGNIKNFQYLQYHGREGARGNQKLRMGPFGHGQLSGDLEYPDGGGLQGDHDEEIQWFDHWLKGVDTGIMDEPPVKYYLMASARKGAPSERMGWYFAEDWPPPHAKMQWYLREHRQLLPEPSNYKEGKSSYKHDPADPVPTVGGQNLRLPKGPMDQREIGLRRGDYLRFESPELAQDLIVAGPLRCDLYVSSDAPDTDFMVKLVDVYPDGYEAIVIDTALRARYRNGREAEDVQMLKPGESVHLDIDMWNTALVFEKGHKISVHISSSNYPRFEVNPNTGEEPGKQTKEPRVPNNTIYHDAAHPSALILPVVTDPSALWPVGEEVSPKSEALEIE